MPNTEIHAQTLFCQLQLLNVYLELEAIAGLELSTDAWQEYTSEDYDTPEDYCHSCLVDLNDYRHYERKANLCWLPIKAPRKSKVVYLEALHLAQEFLLKPENEYTFGDRMLRIRAADSLVSLFQSFGQSPDPALVELSKSE